MVEERQFDDDIYKKWYKTKDRSGFVSLNGWLEAGKASIDVGELNNEQLKGSTKVWVNAVELFTYLDSIRQNTSKTLYQKKGNDNPTEESFSYYGGGKVDNQPISRVLKIHHWQTQFGDNPSYDNRSFVIKTGHFHAKEAYSGAFIRDASKPPLSVNMIKMSRLEMVEMAIRMELALHGFAAKNNDFFRSLNGNVER